MSLSNVIGRAAMRGLLVVAVMTFVLNLLALVLPVYMLQIYDRVLASASLPTLTYLTLIALAGLAILGAMEAIRQVVVQRIGARLEVDLGERLLAATVHTGGRADAAALGRDLAQARMFLTSPVFSALLDLPFTPLFLVLVFLIHPALGALVVAGAAVLLVITILNQFAVRASQGRSVRDAAIAGQLVAAFTRNNELLRAMGMLPAAATAWGQTTAAALDAQDRATRINAVLAGISRFIRMGVQIGILGLGAYLTLKQEITAGMIFATSLVAARALTPIDNLVAGWKGLLQTLIGLRTVDRALAAVPILAARTQLPAPKGHISFEKVVYLPQGAPEPTIKGVSLSIAAGEAVCVVGPSGAGKSTVARLAAGALTPTQGVVRLDGSDFENWDPLDRGPHVGYLPQDVELLPASVAQNIARLDADAPADRVLAAATLAAVSELVKRLPDGYDTRVGPGGLPLSGGQRQRIALARAVYGPPRVVVLDEPNAHLDRDGEAALNTTILQLKRAGVTVIVVSQRAGVLQAIDRVLFMRDGQIAASQSRDEALARLSGTSVPVAAEAPARTATLAREARA